MHRPSRGDLWLVDLAEPVGHESGLTLPVLVASVDRFNRFGFLSGLPVTRTRRGYPTHIEIGPGVSGLRETSYVQVEQVTSLSTERLVQSLGAADFVVMHEVDRTLRLFFGLD